MAARHRSWGQIHLLLACALVAAVLLSLSIGSFYFSPAQIFRFVGHWLGLAPIAPEEALDLNVFATLRVPRVLLCRGR